MILVFILSPRIGAPLSFWGFLQGCFTDSLFIWHSTLRKYFHNDICIYFHNVLWLHHMCSALAFEPQVIMLSGFLIWHHYRFGAQLTFAFLDTHTDCLIASWIKIRKIIKGLTLIHDFSDVLVCSLYSALQEIFYERLYFWKSAFCTQMCDIHWFMRRDLIPSHIYSKHKKLKISFSILYHMLYLLRDFEPI